MTGTKTRTKPSSSASSRPKSSHALSGSAPLSEFQNLGNGILFFDPPPSPSPQNHDDDHGHGHDPPQPQLIILCTWLGGATPRRIAKYTSGYRRLFPHSPILVIRTVIADFTVRSEQAIRRNLAPARDIIRDVLSRDRSASIPHANSAPEEHGSYGTETAPGVLLHIFSNGGCHLAVQLAHSFLLSSFDRQQALPVRLQILDSCPGTFSIAKTYGAAVHSVPKTHPWVLQSIERWGLWGAVVFIAVLQQGLPRAIGENVVRRRLLGGVGVDFEGMRGEVLRDEVWGAGGGQGKETGRLYLYSKADEAVGWRDVERHIREARKLVKERAVLANKERGRGRGRREEVFEAGVEGLVRAERFEKASHCALVMEDEERYWRAVRESWEGHMERRRRRGRQSVDEGSKEVVLGATDEQGKEQMSDKEPRTKSGVVEDGVESREAEVSRRSRTSKL